MEPRRGNLTCEACTETLPCREKFLTFGAYYGSQRWVTRIALTKFLCLERHFGDECPAFNPATETPSPITTTSLIIASSPLAMVEQQAQEQVCLE